MPALTQAEKAGIDEVLDFLEQLLKCFRALPHGTTRSDPIWETRLAQAVADLKALNAAGGIDWQPNPNVNAGAETDGNGIHLNPNHRAVYPYSLPARLAADDCETFDFESLWKLIEILLHEWYHYAYHTGVLGLVVFKAIGNLLHLGGFLSGHVMGGVRKLATGEPYYSPAIPAGHEFHAYNFTHWMLKNLSHWLFWICETRPRCLPCCGQHARFCQDAAERQDAWSWY